MYRFILLGVLFMLAATGAKSQGEYTCPDIKDNWKEHGDSLFYNEDFEQALFFYRKVLECAQNENDRQKETIALLNIGKCCDLSGKYKNAATHYYKALKMAEESGNEEQTTEILINLGILFFNLKKSGDAIAYYQRALTIANKTKDTISQVRALNNIGNTYMTLNLEFKKAEPYFRRTVELGKMINHRAAIKVGLTNLTEIYSNTHRLDSAIILAKKVLEFDTEGCFGMYNLANIFRLNNEYDSALFYFKKVSRSDYTEPGLLAVVLKDISDIYQENNNYYESYQFLKKYNTIRDSIHKIEAEKEILNLKSKYESEQKDFLIDQLSLKARIRNGVILFLSLITTFILVLLFYIYRHLKQKKIIAEQDITIMNQQILQLEKDKQIIATTSALKGEENERTRIARDLHDGLGGLLSGIKLRLNYMKGRVFLDEKGQEMFSNALQLLDNSVTELHHVANNMMPENLMRYGLKSALENFHQCLDSHDSSKIIFQFFGNETRFQSDFEMTIYRTAQELLNNAIKHSGATEIFLQLMVEDERLNISYQDNGKGFDPDRAINANGKGLSNIQARVQAFDGRYDIISSPGNGTEFIIEFLHTNKYICHDSGIDC